MSKISELSDGGALQSTDYLIAVRSGGNVKVQLSELPSGIGAGGNIVFGDNEKAIFGAGSDLQIYHDGSNSYVQDSGTGHLFLQGTELYLRNGAGTANYLKAVNGGQVDVYHNDVVKLTTTPTGIDVTGTVTADGLTVDTTAPFMSFKESGATKFFIGESSAVGGGAGYYDLYAVTGLGQRFFTNATERMRITSAGNVGIGTTSPNSLLDVRGGNVYVDGGGSGGASQVILATSASSGANFGQISNTGTRWSLGYGAAIGTVGTEVLTWNSSGNVGIGTTSPDVKLELSGSNSGSTNDSPAATLRLTDTDGSTAAEQPIGKIEFYGSDGTVPSVDVMAYILSKAYSASGGGDLRFGVCTSGSASEAMRIDASGNLLVGKTAVDNSVVGVTASGGQLSAVCQDAAPLFGNRTNSDGDIALFRKDNTTVGAIGVEGGDLTIGNADTGLQFVNTSQIIRPQNLTTNSAIDAQVDLGQSAYRFKDLYLSGGVNFEGASGNTLFKSGSDLILTNRAAGALIVGTNNTERMRIDSNGNLFVGTTVTYPGVSGLGGNIKGMMSEGGGSLFLSRVDSNPVLYINRGGTDGDSVRFAKDAGSTVGSISVTASATAYNTSSDARLKENIADAEDAGAKVDAIQVRQFDWKADGSHQDYGMIAQELMTVAPEAVSGDPESDDMMGVDYSKLVPMLVKEIQSLRARVAQLEGV